ncbi:MAG: radical SAM protein [Alphaproteobacteria bacterium]|nr:radical SAM protein [Alphaproteobacteria bacterium]
MPPKVIEIDPVRLGANEPALAQAERIIARLFPARSVGRVLLIAPPDADSGLFDFEVARRRRYWNHPQYGLGLVGAVLRKAGYEVRVLNLNHVVLGASQTCEGSETFDFTATVEQSISREIDTFAPDLVGVTCMYSLAHKSMTDVCARVRAHDASLPLFVGGIHVTNSFVDPLTRESLLDALSFVDGLVLYEAEYAFLDFLEVVNHKAGSERLRQLALFDGDSLVHFSAWHRPNGAELDVIPAHDLIASHEMSSTGRVGAFYSLVDPRVRMATAQLNRGCRFQCTFCSVRNFNGLGVRNRSVSSVLEELKILRFEHGVGHITWLDDDLLYDRKRAIELFEGIARDGIDITWDCSNGLVAGSCAEDVIAAAAGSGCIGLYLGIESGNAEILRRIRKPGNPDVFLRAAETVRRHESIHTRAFLIIGFPGETFDMLRDTFWLAREMDLDWCHVNVLQTLPNTPMFAETAADQESIDFTEIRFTSGGFGKHQKSRDPKARAVFLRDFPNIFDRRPGDSVPSREELDDVWAYINFYANFARLFREDRPRKLEQNLRYVKNIIDVVDPDNAFAYYFAAYLAKRLNQAADQAWTARCESLVNGNEVWQNRFIEVGIEVGHLKSGGFSVPEARFRGAVGGKLMDAR